MPTTIKTRRNWTFGFLAGLALAAACNLPPSKSFAQDVRLIYPTEDVSSAAWDTAVMNFRLQNPLAGTVMIGREIWTPERQAADPKGFNYALTAARERAESPEAVAARKAERERMAEVQRAAKEQREADELHDRQVRLARLNFEWQRIAGFQLAAYAVPIKLEEVHATATANALALKSSQVNVNQSPGLTALPVAPTTYTPEQKARVIRRFLEGEESLTQIALESRVRPDVAKLWIKQALRVTD